MWTKIKGSEYFISFTQDNGYEINVTNYISLWTTFYSDKALLAQLKYSNEGLELENDNDFYQNGLYLLSNFDQLKKLSIKKDDTGNSLFITMKIIFGYPFNFECKLSKGSDRFYFEKVTLPLLKIIKDLRSSQSELRHILIKKDNEIEEYKSEGGEIVLRHLKTLAFNDEEHMFKHKAYEEVFGTADIPLSLFDKPAHNPDKSVKCDPIFMPNRKEQNSHMSRVGNESNTVPLQPLKIKQESHTQGDCTPLLINCQQEPIKLENLSNQTLNNNHRKRIKKLNL